MRKDFNKYPDLTGQAALTKKEFISKRSISLKESWETRYWLELLVKSKYLSDYKKIFQIQKDIESIISMLTKIIKSSQNNLQFFIYHLSSLYADRAKP